MNCEACGAALGAVPRCSACGHLTVRHPRAGHAERSGGALRAVQRRGLGLRLLVLVALVALVALAAVLGGNAHKLAALRAEFHEVVDVRRYRRITEPAMVREVLAWASARDLPLRRQDVEIRIRPGAGAPPAPDDEIAQAARTLRARLGTAPVQLDVRALVEVETLGWVQQAVLAVQADTFTAVGGFVPTPPGRDFGRLTPSDAERSGAALATGGAKERMALVRPLIAAIEAQRIVESALPHPSPKQLAALEAAMTPIRQLPPTLSVGALGPDGPFALAGYLRLAADLRRIAAPGTSVTDRADYNHRRDKIMGRLARLLDAHGVHLAF